MRTMKSGIKFKRGEIILVPFPFTDMSKSKLRPVLIISNISHNKKSLTMFNETSIYFIFWF